MRRACLTSTSNSLRYCPSGAEVRYLMSKEWARFPEDVLWRRSKLGLTMSAADREALAAFMANAG
jgi:glycerol-3-phosphate dehydrogenase